MLLNNNKEEEEYRPHASGRIYDFDSDESLNRYDHENYCMPFQPAPNFCQYGSSERLFPAQQLAQRRHSSFSHEDILHMKYQNPPVDPRYRDNRPFSSSNSSIYDHARRDFMSRRRSSSSLQDDLLRPFQQLQLDTYLRRSNPVINHNNSSPNLTKCNSNWNLNPSIYIEEYNDNATEVKSNNSSTNLSYTEPHQPLNEETVAPFAGCDEIPFIDDEHTEHVEPVAQDSSSHYCDIYMPMVNCVEQQKRQQQLSQRQPMERSMPSYIKNRKTVSFDLVGSDEELNAIRQSNLLNKSNTCDHITNIKLNEQHKRIAGTKPIQIPIIPPPPAPPSTSIPTTKEKHQAAAHSCSEPIFKFCTLKNADIPKGQPIDSFKTQTAFDNDSLSAYFYENSTMSQDQLHALDIKQPQINEPKSIIDTKSILLDLSELNSDTMSSTSSSQAEPNEIKSKTINPSYVNPTISATTKKLYGIEKFAYIPAWNPPEFCDHIAYGNGKVRALKNYFEGLKMPDRQFSESSPDLSKKSNKLSETERQTVLEQLKEWSEFGTSTIDHYPTQAQTCKSIQTNPITHSVLNLTVTTSYNDESCSDRLTVATRSCSEPNVNDYILTENMLLPQPKKKLNLLNDTVPAERKNFCANIKTTHKITKSCPNLCRNSANSDKPYYVSSKLRTNIYNSPCHRSTNLTVRKVKQIQKNTKRVKKCKGNGNCPFAKAGAAADEARWQSKELIHI